MKLTTILQTLGTHVWNFREDTELKTITEAQARVQSYLRAGGKYEKTKVRTVGAVMTSIKDYKSEPVLVIEVLA